MYMNMEMYKCIKLAVAARRIEINNDAEEATPIQVKTSNGNRIQFIDPNKTKKKSIFN